MVLFVLWVLNHRVSSVVLCPGFFFNFLFYFESCPFFTSCASFTSCVFPLCLPDRPSACMKSCVVHAVCSCSSCYSSGFRLGSWLWLVLSPASTFSSCFLIKILVVWRCIQIPLFLVGGRKCYVYTQCSLWVWIRSLCLSILLSKHLTLPAMMARTLGLCFLPSPHLPTYLWNPEISSAAPVEASLRADSPWLRLPKLWFPKQNVTI